MSRYTQSRPWLLLFTLFALTSAVLLAEMSPTQDVAERILKARFEEIKKEGVAKWMPSTQSTAIKPTKVSGRELIRANGEVTAEANHAAYILHYEISPRLQEEPPLREVTLAIEWQPDPAVKQTQRIRMINTIEEPHQESRQETPQELQNSAK